MLIIQYHFEQIIIIYFSLWLTSLYILFRCNTLKFIINIISSINYFIFKFVISLITPVHFLGEIFVQIAPEKSKVLQ